MGSNGVREKKVVELVIMMDTTGSMESSIEMCKQHAKSLARMSKMAIPTDFDMKVGFISYKDHGDQGQLELIQFTRDEESLDRFIQGLKASGGGDAPEDVVGGLKAAVEQLNWSGSTRLLVHFADYPCHGREFHNEVDDTYPRLCPHGVKPQTLLAQLAGLGVDYYFVKVIPQHTDMMVAKFKEAHARIFESMHVNEFKADFLTAMLGALSRSMGVRPLTGEALAARLAQARAR
eukprot:gene25799-11473_t